MMSLLAHLVLLQCACVFAIPLFRFSFRPVADMAQTVSLAELNRRTASPFLYAVNGRSVQQISEVGLNTFDIDLSLGFRETTCPRGGANHLGICLDMWSPSMVTGSCSSRVRVSRGYALLLSLHCVIDSSSSESSSEEEGVLVRVRAPIAAQVPGIVLCRGAGRCSRLLW
ncbi:hypothetical protein ACEWY4_022758 [Coilia grayii]|uniref:Secreted protein n=1 Tax=Coilia grayii TaxID=363190 RepID=A0ABD1J330_9TELE